MSGSESEQAESTAMQLDIAEQVIDSQSEPIQLNNNKNDILILNETSASNEDQTFEDDIDALNDKEIAGNNESSGEGPSETVILEQSEKQSTSAAQPPIEPNKDSPSPPFTIETNNNPDDKDYAQKYMHSLEERLAITEKLRQEESKVKLLTQDNLLLRQEAAYLRTFCISHGLPVPDSSSITGLNQF
jgi:hypothetical protein